MSWPHAWAVGSVHDALARIRADPRHRESFVRYYLPSAPCVLTIAMSYCSVCDSSATLSAAGRWGEARRLTAAGVVDIGSSGSTVDWSPEPNHIAPWTHAYHCGSSTNARELGVCMGLASMIGCAELGDAISCDVRLCTVA